MTSWKRNLVPLVLFVPLLGLCTMQGWMIQKLEKRTEALNEHVEELDRSWIYQLRYFEGEIVRMRHRVLQVECRADALESEHVQQEEAGP